MGGPAAIALSQPARRADAGIGLTITEGWGFDGTALFPSTAADCLHGVTGGNVSAATSASSSVSVNYSSTTIDVDAVLYFSADDTGPGRSVELKAQGVDIDHGC